MRRLAALAAAILLSATTARADDFWRDVAEPHAEEVRHILELANMLMGEPGAPQVGIFDNPLDPDAASEARMRRFDDAFGMLRYARRLAPDHLEVLASLGRAADESGRTAPAIEAFTAYLARAREPSDDVHRRLGVLYLRQGRRDEALHHLRIALASTSAYTAVPAAVQLAAAYEDAGRPDQAVATLGAVRATTGYWTGDTIIALFALAVACDRDEQLTAAWEVLDRMQKNLGPGYGDQVQAAMRGLRLVPAIDLHYWRALFYETLGDLSEARAEWLHYATGGDAAHYRGRALDHVAAVDHLLADRTARRQR